jgi:putative transposase
VHRTKIFVASGLGIKNKVRSTEIFDFIFQNKKCVYFYNTHLNIKTMANTYTQFYAHLVFAVKNRNALIKKQWKDDLEKYITGIVQNHKHKMLAIGSMPDHIHIFIGYNINHLIPDLVEEIKTSSNAWVKQNNLSRFRFEWQKGYGAFSHSRSQIDAVVKYVLNQEKHHKKTNFRTEYLEILRKNDVQFNDAYLFDFFDDVNDWE